MTKKDVFKHSFLIFTLFLTVVITALSISSTITIRRRNIVNQYDFANLQGEANRVILFIGDGMGENHLNVAEKYLERTLYMRSFSNSGKVSTFSKNLFIPTDSAASATAMATGKKVINREVSYHNKENINTITEYAKMLGKGVGIVTTDNLYGATPAAFSSHAADRGDSDTIIKNQIKSNVDIFLGCGKNAYGKYQTEIINNGYTFVTSMGELKNQNHKILGAFDAISGDNLNPTLIELSLFALSYLEKNYPDGYFLLIEGAHIDKMSHKNNIIKMIAYLDEFDKTIEEVDKTMRGKTSYTIIVTADHETGKLKSNGELKENITDKLYNSKGHTSRDVCYFIKGSLATKKEYNIQKKIDNTDIYKICYQLLSNKGANNDRYTLSFE